MDRQHDTTADGTVNGLGRTMHRHRHPDFIRFLNEIVRTIPADKTVHAILDTYCTHKQEKMAGPRWTFPPHKGRG